MIFNYIKYLYQYFTEKQWNKTQYLGINIVTGKEVYSPAQPLMSFISFYKEQKERNAWINAAKNARKNGWKKSTKFKHSLP
jgi:hypothetical protein